MTIRTARKMHRAASIVGGTAGFLHHTETKINNYFVAELPVVKGQTDASIVHAKSAAQVNAKPGARQRSSNPKPAVQAARRHPRNKRTNVAAVGNTCAIAQQQATQHD